MVPVPQRFLPDILSRLGELYKRTGAVADAGPVNVVGIQGAGDLASDGVAAGWSDEALLQRCWRESPPAMRKVLARLLQDPDADVPITNLAKAVYGDDELKTSQKMAGVLGAFGRRTKNRYGLATWAFAARFDYEREPQLWVYRMPGVIAAVFLALWRSAA